VITEDQATRLLKRADPARFDERVPFVDATGYLAALRTRSTTVTLIKTETTPTQPEGRHRWPIIAVAAAAVVAIVVGALMLAARDDSAPPVPADTTVAPVPDAAPSAEVTARGFVDAYVANDTDQAFSYLTEGAITEFWGSPAEFRGEIAWNVATGFTMTNHDCEQLADDPEAGITVRCGYEFHMLGSDALGNGPYRENYWDLTIRDEEVVSAERQLPESNGWLLEAWTPFNSWIKAEHPDDVLVMYTTAAQGDRVFTPEALQVWEQRTHEYVESVLTARATYAADIGGICANWAPRLSELAVPAQGALDQIAAESTAAAAIMHETYGELIAVDAPTSTDMTAYEDFRSQLIRLVHIVEGSAEAAIAGDSARVAELEAEYRESRQAMTAGPAGSGLEECLASLPG
jgi:hypothetical protein